MGGGALRMVITSICIDRSCYVPLGELLYRRGAAECNVGWIVIVSPQPHKIKVDTKQLSLTQAAQITAYSPTIVNRKCDGSTTCHEVFPENEEFVP